MDSNATDSLIDYIEEGFRVRPNHDPVFVDINGHLNTVSLAQHQVVFGRRGSGKSCLLVTHHRRSSEFDTLSIYIDIDEHKRLRYPDLLIRLLIDILEAIPGSRRSLIARFFGFRRKPIERHLDELREQLARADTEQVQLTRETTTARSSGAEAGHAPASINASRADETSMGRTSEYKEEKLDMIERRLSDYKKSLNDALRNSGHRMGALLVDDFYLIPRSHQPDVVDYLHRLLRGTDLYLKIGTIRHRTSLLRFNGQTIGVELTQDVQEINLDQTLEDLEATESYLFEMLTRMAEEVGMDDISPLFNPDAPRALALASGGVPRDYLTVFVEALREARNHGAGWLTPTAIYKGASRIVYRTKLANLRIDTGTDAGVLEAVFQDLLRFCLQEKAKTAFLISQTERADHETEHEVIQELMDLKLIHVIEPDTSAASGRPGRYEAYTLDFSLFMEPRRRGIEHVEFWRIDEGRRREGVREAPVYPLTRVRGLMTMQTGGLTSEELIEELERSGLVGP